MWPWRQVRTFWRSGRHKLWGQKTTCTSSRGARAESRLTPRWNCASVRPTLLLTSHNITHGGEAVKRSKKRSTVFARAVGILPCLVAGLMFIGYEAPVASAQVLYGSIAGTVTDRTGSVVPKTVVKVTSTTTGLSREATADSAGYYSISNLPQGDYELSATATGFKPLTQKGVTVLINNVTHMDVTLEVGGVTETIKVEVAPPPLQTTKADVNVNLESQAISNLPLPAYRNYQSLINLVPGATPGRLQNAVTDTPGRALTTNVNGQERRS